MAVVDGEHLRLLGRRPFRLRAGAGRAGREASRTGAGRRTGHRRQRTRWTTTRCTTGRSAWRILPAVDHPGEPARCLVSGTGLSHIRSAGNRQAMHAAGEQITDSMRMYQWGVEGGRPAPGASESRPSGSTKAPGLALRAHNEPLDVPDFAEDGGEEPEIAGVYIIDAEGMPRRIGMAAGNEFSDHEFEKKNYLYLASSKLRTCAIGPELVLDPDFDLVPGEVTIERAGDVLWSKPIQTGESGDVPQPGQHGAPSLQVRSAPPARRRPRPLLRRRRLQLRRGRAAGGWRRDAGAVRRLRPAAAQSAAARRSGTAPVRSARWERRGKMNRSHLRDGDHGFGHGAAAAGRGLCGNGLESHARARRSVRGRRERGRRHARRGRSGSRRRHRMVADDARSRGAARSANGALSRAPWHGADRIEHHFACLGPRTAGACGSTRLSDARRSRHRQQAAGAKRRADVSRGRRCRKCWTVSARCWPMSRGVVHLGESGAGAMMKLINNFLCGVQAAALAEAMAWIERSGLDKGRGRLNILTGGAPGSPLVKALSERMSHTAYHTNFRLDLMAKDLRYSIQSAQGLGVELATGAAALQRFEEAGRRGFGDRDLSAVIEVLRARG